MTAVGSTRRAPPFQYPALPKFELRLYLCVFVCTLVYAWYSLIVASNKYVFRFHGRRSPVTVFPLIGPRYKDDSNWEWSRWSPFAVALLPYMLFHSAVFNIGGRFFSETTMQYTTILYSVIGASIVYTPRLVLLSILQGTFIFATSTFAKTTISVWASALPILYYIMNRTQDVTDDPFLVLIFVAYSLLSFISYNLEAVRGHIRPEDDTVWKQYARMMFYVFYPPYMITLIVLYPDFEKQMRERTQRKYDWRQIICFATKIIFWWSFLHLILYFVYFEAILNDHSFANNLPKNQFVALGMAMGNFFHIKYVVIFGFMSIFAQLDKMQPPEGPICIARVALYSKIWRYFDRGLYAFFKEYIFVPICWPTFSLPRKLLGLFISYGFVLLWHGLYHHNIVWIALNIIELIVEYTAKGLYSVESVRNWREKHLSDSAFRRALAWMHIVPFVFGLYSNFYFLGGSRIGYMFVQRIWNEETLTLQYPSFLLILLGYFYTNMTIESERMLSARKESNKRMERTDQENKELTEQEVKERKKE